MNGVLTCVAAVKASLRPNCRFPAVNKCLLARTASLCRRGRSVSRLPTEGAEARFWAAKLNSLDPIPLGHPGTRAVLRYRWCKTRARIARAVKDHMGTKHFPIPIEERYRPTLTPKNGDALPDDLSEWT